MGLGRTNDAHDVIGLASASAVRQCAEAFVPARLYPDRCAGVIHGWLSGISTAEEMEYCELVAVKIPKIGPVVQAVVSRPRFTLI